MASLLWTTPKPKSELQKFVEDEKRRKQRYERIISKRRGNNTVTKPELGTRSTEELLNAISAEARKNPLQDLCKTLTKQFAKISKAIGSLISNLIIF
jgi:hypothetical protein